MNRLTLKDIEAAIAETHYIRPDIGARTLTICILVLRNGFTVVGEQACADPAIFDEEMGKDFARSNAIEKVWALEGYLLKQRMHQRAGLGVSSERSKATQDAVAQANYVASLVGAAPARAPRPQEMEAADSMFGLALPIHVFSIKGSPYHGWIDSKMCHFEREDRPSAVLMIASVPGSSPVIRGTSSLVTGNGKVTEFGLGQLREAAMRRLNENVENFRKTGRLVMNRAHLPEAAR